jgi:predicted nucleotidyltransferase
MTPQPCFSAHTAAKYWAYCFCTPAELRTALAPLADRIRIAFVYGSVASGEERVASDIDVIAIGTAKLEDVIRALHPYQEALRREINPHLYKPTEFEAKLRDKGSRASKRLDQDDLGRDRGHPARTLPLGDRYAAHVEAASGYTEPRVGSGASGFEPGSEGGGLSA